MAVPGVDLTGVGAGRDFVNRGSRRVGANLEKC